MLDVVAIQFTGTRKPSAWAAALPGQGGQGRPLRDVVNATQFASQLNEFGGSSYDFTDNRLLEVGTRRQPSRDKFWAIGGAPSTVNPRRSRPELTDVRSNYDEHDVYPSLDRARALTPADSPVRRGLGSWVGRAHARAPERVFWDLTEFHPGVTRADQRRAEVISRGRREAAIFNPSTGTEVKTPPKRGRR